MGGVWERQIRTIKSVLFALLEKNGSQLNDKVLRTFMCEAEAVTSSRPLTTDKTTSPVSLEALIPNHLLTVTISFSCNTVNFGLNGHLN